MPLDFAHERLERSVGVQAEGVAAAAPLLHERAQWQRALLGRNLDRTDLLDARSFCQCCSAARTQVLHPVSVRPAGHQPTVTVMRDRRHRRGLRFPAAPAHHCQNVHWPHVLGECGIGSQRPFSNEAFTALSGEPAWKTIPSWYMVATQDHAIPPATERFMAQRAHASTVEVDSSHVAMISQPEATTRLILDAADSIH